MTETSILIAIFVVIGSLFAIDRARLMNFRNSVVDQTIPVQVKEIIRTSDKLRALRRRDLFRKGSRVEILFAGHLRVGTIRRSYTKRAEVMLPNKKGHLFPVRRRMDTIRLQA